ncbi:MAG: DUF2924 domain-containing protein [Planctomycetota bacterium]
MSKPLPSGRLKPLELMRADPFMAEQLERLQAMSMLELLDEHLRLWGKPSRVKHRAFVWKRCARKIQEVKYGGLSRKAQDRLEELIGMLGIDFSKPINEADQAVLKPDKPNGGLISGTTLVREWKGTQIIVHILAKGFEYDGDHYRSLSAIAKKITGSHCNGRAWFKLTNRKKRA